LVVEHGALRRVAPRKVEHGALRRVAPRAAAQPARSCAMSRPKRNRKLSIKLPNRPRPFLRRPMFDVQFEDGTSHKVEHGALRRVAPRLAAQRVWSAVGPRMFLRLCAGGGRRSAPSFTTVGSWSQCMRKIERRLSRNRPNRRTHSMFDVPLQRFIVFFHLPKSSGTAY